jgi:hypothetical protein
MRSKFLLMLSPPLSLMKIQVKFFLAAEYTGLLGSGQEAVEESDDAHVVVFQKILNFVGDYDEEYVSLLVLEDFVLHVDN